MRPGPAWRNSRPPARLEQYRIDRLCELRAVVESLRCERETELLLDVRCEYQGFSQP
jgi:hypothetical protein